MRLQLIAITALLSGCGTAAATSPVKVVMAPSPAVADRAIAATTTTVPVTTTSTTVPATTTTTRYVPPPTTSTTRYVPPTPPTTRYVPPTTIAPTTQVSMSSVWQCIGFHESGNNPTENTGNGYYGEFQFVPSSWDNMMKQLGLGYQSYPYAASAPASVQLEAAQLLQREAGWGQWPVTSRECGE